MDYTTATAVFDYGNTLGAGADPVNQREHLESIIIPGVSRAIDAYCDQRFGLRSVIRELAHAHIDRDGLLTAVVNAPVVGALVSATLRIGNNAEIALSVDSDSCEITDRQIGALLEWYGSSYDPACRSRPLVLRVTGDLGYATLDALPSDLRLAATMAAWHEYNRRNSLAERTAIVELGMLTVSSSWPQNILMMLRAHRRVLV